MSKGFTNANWSKHAKSYEALAETITGGWARDALRVAHHRLHPRLLEQQRAGGRPFEFLDVGCGPGILTFEFAAKYAAGGAPFHITATDLADGMLERVNARLSDNAAFSRFADRIATLQMDGRQLDKLPDASVDAIGSNFGLTIFPERPTGWQSARRVLIDDGLLVVTAWHDSSANLEWFDTLTKLLNAAKADTGEPPMPLPSSLAGSGSIFDELSAAGFRDIETYQTTHTVIEDFDVLLGSILDNPVAANFLEHLSKEAVIEVIAKLLRQHTDAIATQTSAAGDASARAVALFNMTAVTFVASK